MILNPKSLCLALVAILAMNATVASTASAQGKLTAAEPVTLTGTETGPASANQLTAFGVSVRCPGSTGTGHKYNQTPHTFIPSGESTFTLTSNLKQTTAEGKANCILAGLNWTATADFNGCDYVVHIGGTVDAGAYTGTADIVCPPGNEITWTAWTTEAAHIAEPNNPFCIFHIPPQTGLTGARGLNTPGGHIGLTGTIGGITITRTASPSHPVLCPESTSKTAQLNLDVTISGDSALGVPVPISISH